MISTWEQDAIIASLKRRAERKGKLLGSRFENVLKFIAMGIGYITAYAVAGTIGWIMLIMLFSI